MSERMTNDETRRFIEAVNNMNALGGNEVHVPREVMIKVAQEISAGRSSEVQKDAVIKALADALERHGWACRVTLGQPRPDVCGCVGCDTAHALRLAGRL